MSKDAQHDDIIGVEMEVTDIVEGNDGGEELEKGRNEVGQEEGDKHQNFPLVGSRDVLPKVVP